MAQWLWRLQSDTLGLSPAVACFFLFSTFSPSGLDSNETSIIKHLTCNYFLLQKKPAAGICIFAKIKTQIAMKLSICKIYVILVAVVVVHGIYLCSVAQATKYSVTCLVREYLG